MHDEKTTVLNEVAVTSERYQENILYDDYQFPVEIYCNSADTNIQ